MTDVNMGNETRIEFDCSEDRTNPINIEETPEEEAERRARRKARIEAMKREKQRAIFLQKRVIPAVAVCVVGFIVFGIVSLVKGSKNEITDGGKQINGTIEEQGSNTVREETEAEHDSVNLAIQANQDGNSDNSPIEQEVPEVFQAERTKDTAGFPDTVISEYGVFLDVENNKIIAGKGENTRISPASMTKILTILTAADALGIQGADWENSPVLDETFTITIQITDYSFVNDCSNVGFEVGEEVTVRDLFYGTILPSGADAAVGLACFVAGTQEEFVELMNQKLESLGMSDSSHMTNCVGLYDKEHYSTAYDIAVMLKTAADNPFCRDVLSAHIYTTAATQQHPEGILISNWFLRRIEDKDTHGEVLCAKTGYVVQSKNCAASLARDGKGKEYICVTAGSTSTWRCIYDHVELYQKWLEVIE